VPFDVSSPWWSVFGRLHLLVLHFPIALVLVAGALELLRPGAPARGASGAGRCCLRLGAVGAIAAATTGWVYAGTGFGGGTTAIAWHRWVAVGTLVLVLIATGLGEVPAVRRPGNGHHLYRTLLAFACVGIAWTGHLGGSLVHGNDFLVKPILPEPPPEYGPEAAAAEKSRRLVSPGTRATAAEGDEPAASTVTFAADVQPILARWCYECHRADKKFDDVQLDTRSGVLRQIVAGDPDASRLVQVLELPVDDRYHMPMNGPALPEESIATIRAWIETLDEHHGGDD